MADETVTHTEQSNWFKSQKKQSAHDLAVTSVPDLIS